MTKPCENCEKLKTEISRWGSEKQVYVRENLRLKKQLEEAESEITSIYEEVAGADLWLKTNQKGVV